jgi:hypothetical protein
MLKRLKPRIIIHSKDWKTYWIVVIEQFLIVGWNVFYLELSLNCIYCLYSVTQQNQDEQKIHSMPGLLLM